MFCPNTYDPYNTPVFAEAKRSPDVINVLAIAYNGLKTLVIYDSPVGLKRLPVWNMKTNSGFLFNFNTAGAFFCVKDSKIVKQNANGTKVVIGEILHNGTVVRKPFKMSPRSAAVCDMLCDNLYFVFDKKYEAQLLKFRRFDKKRNELYLGRDDSYTENIVLGMACGFSLRNH